MNCPREREWPFGGSSEDEEIDGGHSFTTHPLKSQILNDGTYSGSTNDRKAERESRKDPRVVVLADTRFNQVEELSLPPSQTKTVYVSLTPLERVPEEYGTSSTSMIVTRRSENACLKLRAYRLLFQFSEHEGDPLTQTTSHAMRLMHPRGGDGNQHFHPLFERLADDSHMCIPIMLRARVCTSLLSVSPEVVPFGECQIGEYKSAHVTISNLSDLPAVATQQLTSKTLSCQTSTLSIPPHSSVDLKLEYVPTKITSAYHKTIRVVNCMNTCGDVTIQVKASNVDTHDVLLHSAFYKVRVNNQMKQQQVYFNRVTLNCPTIQAFHIENISQRKLRFELSTSSPDEVQLYKITDDGGHDGTSVSSFHSSTQYEEMRSTGCLSELEKDGRHAEQHLETATEYRRGHVVERNREKGTSRRRRQRSRSLNRDTEDPSSSNLAKLGSGGKDTEQSGTSSIVRSPTNLLPPYNTNTSNLNFCHPDGMAFISNDQAVNPKNGLVEEQEQKAKMISSTPYYSSTTSTKQFERNSHEGSRDDIALDTLERHTPLKPRRSSFYDRSVNQAADSTAVSSCSSIATLDSDDRGVKSNTKRPDFVALRKLLDLFHMEIALSKEKQTLLRAPPFTAAASEASHGNDMSRNGSAMTKVEKMKNKMELLRRAISSGALTLIAPNDVVRMQPGEEVSIIVMLKLASGDSDQVKGSSQMASSTIARHIHIRLLDVNSSHLPFSLSRLAARQHSQPPLGKKGEGGRYSNLATQRRIGQTLQVRSLLIRAKAYRSEMFVVQKNISFGRVSVTDFATKSVFVENRSSVPLLYSIAKSGSISSGFLQIPQGGSGVVPSHGSVEIQFVFRPSLAGPFEEMLSIINVCDSSNTQIITIKARVFQPEPFALVDPPPQLSFGPSLVGALERPPSCIVKLSNTTSRRRYLVIQGVGSNDTTAVALLPQSSEEAGSGDGDQLAPPFPFSPVFTFVVEFQGNQAAIPRGGERQDIEDKLEHYRLKLRIAERKGKTSKVSKLRSRVDLLVRRLNGEDLGQTGDDISECESDSDADTITRIKGNSEDSSVSSMATFVLEAQCTVSIFVSLAFIPGPSGLAGWKGGILFNGAVLFYESRNKDIVKELPCTASVFSSTAEYTRAILALESLNDDEAVGFASAASKNNELQPGDDLSPTMSEEQNEFERRKHSESSLSSQSVVSTFSNQSKSLSVSSLLLPAESSSQDPPIQSSVAPASRDMNDPNHAFFVTTPQHCLVQRDLLLQCSTLKNSEDWDNEILVSGIRIMGTSDMGNRATPSFTVHSTMNKDTKIELRWVANDKCEEQNVALQFGLKTGKKKKTTAGIGVVGRGCGENGDNAVRTSPKKDQPSFVSTSLLTVLRPDAALEVALSYVGSDEHVSKILQMLPRVVGYVHIIALEDDCSGRMVPSRSDANMVGLGKETPGSNSTTKSKTFKQRTLLPVLLEPPPELWLQAPTRLDLGDIKLGSSVMNSFSIHNANPSAPAKYVVMCETASSEFNLVSITGAKSGELAPGCIATVTLHAIGTKVGRASQEVVIRNLSNRGEKLRVRVRFTVKPLSYLVFPDHPIDEEGRIKQIDFGNCYVPRFVDDGRDIRPILRPLHIRNISDRQFFLTIVSNLRKQCYVYSSSSADKGTEVWEYSLPPKTEVVFYIGLRPVLPLEARAAGDTRELNGGLRFIGFSKCLQQLEADNEERRKEGSTTTTNSKQLSSSPLKGIKDDAAMVGPSNGDGGDVLSITTTASAAVTAEGRNVDDALHLELIESGLLEYKLFELSVRFVGVVGSSMFKLNPTEFLLANVVIRPPHHLISSTLVDGTLSNFDCNTKNGDGCEPNVGNGGMYQEGTTVLHGEFSVVNGSRGLPLHFEFSQNQSCAGTLKEALEAIRVGTLTGHSNSLSQTTVDVSQQQQPLGSGDESQLAPFIKLVVLGSQAGELPPLSSTVVSFVVILRQWWGLFESDVRVISQDDPEQIQSMHIQIMVQDGTIGITQAAVAFANHDSRSLNESLPPPVASAQTVQGRAAKGFLSSSGNSVPPPPTLNLSYPVCIGKARDENNDYGRMLSFRVAAADAWECFLEQSDGYGTTNCLIELGNNVISGTTTTLYAYSNLPVILQLPTGCSSSAITAASEMEGMQCPRNDCTVDPIPPDILRKDGKYLMRRCSGPLILPSTAPSTLKIKMFFLPGSTTPQLPLEVVQQGQYIPFQGSIAFAYCNSSVKALLQVSGKYCLPHISFISPQISFNPPVMQLGVMGCSHQLPTSIPIQFQLENNCALRVPVILPSGPIRLTPVNESLQPEVNGILIPESTNKPVWLEPMSTSDVELFMQLSAEDTGVWVGQHALSFKLHTLSELICSVGGRRREIVQVNGGELVIHASVSFVSKLLQISRGVTKCPQPDEHFEMVIDTIDIPSPPSTPPIQATFTVENVYSEPMYVTLNVSHCETGGNEEMEVVELKALRAVPSYSLSSLDESDTKVFLHPGEATDILVIASSRHGARLSERYASLDDVSLSSSQTAVKVGEVLLSCSFAPSAKAVSLNVGEIEGKEIDMGTNTSTRVILVEKVEVYAPLCRGLFLNLSSTDIELLLPAIVGGGAASTLSSQHQQLYSVSVPSCFSVENFSPLQCVRFVVSVEKNRDIVKDSGENGAALQLSFNISPTHGVVKPLGYTVVTVQLTKDCCDAFIAQQHRNLELQTSGRDGSQVEDLGSYVLCISDEDYPHYPVLKVRVTPTLQTMLPSLGTGRMLAKPSAFTPELSRPTEIIRELIKGPALEQPDSSGYRLVEDCRPIGSSGSSNPPLLPVLDLGGCTPVSLDLSIFDINLGQQVVEPDGYCGQWELSLIAPPSNKDNVTFKLSLLHDSDAEWLTLGTSSGILAPGEQVNSTLFFGQSRVGVFDTYLTCSNIENPKDLKVVRVRMQVVLDNIKSSAIGGGTFNAASLFQISASPVGNAKTKRETPPTVDFGELIIGFLHEGRSFLIENLSPIPLEFHLSSTLPPAVLHLSTQGRNLHGYSSEAIVVVVPAESCEPVFLSLQSNEKEDIDARVFVTCRLVKDFQLPVRIVASFVLPQLGIQAIKDVTIYEGDDSNEVGKEEEETTLQWINATSESEGTVCEQRIIVSNIGRPVKVFCALRCLTKRFVVQLEKPQPLPSSSSSTRLADNSTGGSGLSFVGLGFGSDEYSSFFILPGEKAVLRIKPNFRELELSDDLETVLNDQGGNGGGSATAMSSRPNGFVNGLIYLYNACQPTEKHKILLRIHSGGTLDLLRKPPTTKELLFHVLPTPHLNVDISYSLFRNIEMMATKFIRLYNTALMNILDVIFRGSSSPLQSTDTSDGMVMSPSEPIDSSSNLVLAREEEKKASSQGLLPLHFSSLQLKILSDALANISEDNQLLCHSASTAKQTYHVSEDGSFFRGGVITTIMEQFDELLFDLIFITDTLIDVALFRHPCPTVNLAFLVYSVVLRHPICSAYVHQNQM